MSRSLFEDNWRAAFAGAENDVPDSLWSKIETDLLLIENKESRKKIFVYQRLAAAVALFALLLGSYIVLDLVAVDDTMTLVESKAITSEKKESNITGEDNNPERGRVVITPLEKTKLNRGQKAASSGLSKSPAGDYSTNTIMVSHQEENEVKGTDLSRKQFYSEGHVPEFPTLKVEVKRKTFYQPIFPRRLPAMPSYYMASNKEKNNAKEGVYASLGFAGGSYDPGQSGPIVAAPSPSFSMMTNPDAAFSRAMQPQSTQASVGTAYSFGANVGKQVADRWMVQGGLGFYIQNINYTSNYASLTTDNSLRVTVADYLDAETILTVGETYPIQSVNQYLSVPMQVGYKLVDRTIDVQINAGISTDFFIKNALRDLSGQAESFSQKAGKNSPYRSVNWSGLMGFELSYQLGDQYSLSLVPGARYAFNSVLKDNAEVSYNPLVLDVGLRLKYVFK